MKNKILGGLYGALIGDAVGVPYEFRSPRKIPAYDQIDMTPPEGYNRAWSSIPVGTYSDDGAQMLCVAECILNHKLMATDLHAVLQQWLNNGYMSVNALTFDVGNQTMSALSVTPNVVIEKLSDDQFSGNGSLMRTLPVAFMYDDPELIVEQAMEFSRATHPSANAQICCALYCLIAHFLLKGNSINEAVDFSLISLYHLKSKYVSTINLVRDYDKYEHTGTGFVIDSLWSAIEAVHRSTSYESAIKLSIAFGNDTDTTACIAGGLAGIIYGVEGIPVRWYDQLQCREVISDLIEKVATK